MSDTSQADLLKRDITEKDAAFITAANPATVLKLLEMIAVLPTKSNGRYEASL